MRRLALLTVAMVALLPLRWFKIAATPAGTVYLHEVGLFILAAVAFATVRPQVFARARDLTFGFTAAMTAGFAVWAAASLYAGVTLSSTLKEVAYLGCFVAVVGLFLTFAESADQSAIRVLRWSGVVTTVVLLLGLALALAVNSINPGRVLADAIASRDPTLIESGLFRPAFAGFGLSSSDTVSQMRHEVFAGLLVSLLVASWAQCKVPFRRRGARWAYHVSVVVAAVLIVLSLSRSIQVATLAWPAFAGIRLLLRGRLSRRAVAATLVVAVGAVASAMTGLLGVLVARVTSSSSVNERGSKLSDALTTIGQHPWAGGQYDDSISSHNFVLDAWLRGGIVMALLMLVALVLVLGRLGRDLQLLARAPRELVAVTAVLVLPLVRMFTIGAGLMTPPEWVALAFGFAAAIGYERELARIRKAAVPRAEVTVRVRPVRHPAAM